MKMNGGLQDAPSGAQPDNTGTRLAFTTDEMANSTRPNLSLASDGAPKKDGSSKRISAIDFTKGTLVLVMVLYHWLSYFHGPYGAIFRYLRFLPPSFIFITGFLVSNAYLRKYDVADSRLPKRLAIRGLKILAIFTALNLAISFLFTGFRFFSADSLFAVYVTGNVRIAGIGKAAAFYILVPISYLLLLSAVLVIVSRYFKYTFYVVAVLLLAGSIVLNLLDFKTGNLELVAIGLLGLVFGYIPIENVNSFVRRNPIPIIVANLAYWTVITFREPNYPLQIAGVFLTLMLIYLLGASDAEPGKVRALVILLGTYPLFGYIAQIAILQLLRGGMRRFEVGPVGLILSFVAALVLTVLAVLAVDLTRSKSKSVDWIYKCIFA